MSQVITIEQAAQKLAEAKDYDSKYYPVMVIGEIGRPEYPIKLSTKKETISLKKCQEIVSNLKQQFPEWEITSIRIMMYNWDYSGISPEDYINMIYGDCGLPFDSRTSKTARYTVKENRLLISDIDGYPIYENYDGMICNDPVALADSLLD